MPDRLCQVCQEPWDAYGVRNGDMLGWQADLFDKGAGCPCCEGSAPDGPVTPTEQLADPSGSLEALSRPEWKRPPPTVLWACEGCQVKAVISQDDAGDVEWRGGQSVHYWHGHGYAYGNHRDHLDPSGDPVHTIGGEHYCPGCAEWCSDCGEVSIFTRSDLMTDTYDPGASFLPEGEYQNAVCIDCYEQIDCEEE